jgi:hypothetical protein
VKRLARDLVCVVLATAFVLGLGRLLEVLGRVRRGPAMEGWQWQRQRSAS